MTEATGTVARIARAATAGVVIAMMMLVGLAAPARADVSDDWYEGWCREGEAGYSVLIDFTGLPAAERGDLAPGKSGYGPHTGDGWLVRCHQGLEPLEEYWSPEDYVETVGVGYTVDSRTFRSTFLGVTSLTETADPDVSVKFDVLTVLPVDGELPPWPDGTEKDEEYPGQPPGDVVAETPVSGMAVIITAYTYQELRQHGQKTGWNHRMWSRWMGVDPNTPEHRPQYAPPLPPEPDDPGEPDEPGGPDDPGEPEEPGGPDDPGEPEKPDTPAAPGDTRTSQRPSTTQPSGTPGQPNARNRPRAPERPGTPPRPGQPQPRGPGARQSGPHQGKVPGHAPSARPAAGQTPRPDATASPTPGDNRNVDTAGAAVDDTTSAPQGQGNVWGSDATTGSELGTGTASNWWYAAPVALAAAGGGAWWLIGRRRDEDEVSEQIDE